MSLPVERVWDYPRPPSIEPVSVAIRIDFGGRVIAQTTAAFRVLETSHPPVYYLPPAAFTCELVRSGQRRSFCEWKGFADYWTLVEGEHRAIDAAWSYPDPVPAFAPLRDHLAVYPAAMEGCFVDGDRVTPQPGGFYGGWITTNLVGPFKGAPGTRHW